MTFSEGKKIRAWSIERRKSSRIRAIPLYRATTCPCSKTLNTQESMDSLPLKESTCLGSRANPVQYTFRWRWCAIKLGKAGEVKREFHLLRWRSTLWSANKTIGLKPKSRDIAGTLRVQVCLRVLAYRVSKVPKSWEMKSSPRKTRCFKVTSRTLITTRPSFQYSTCWRPFKKGGSARTSIRTCLLMLLRMNLYNLRMNRLEPCRRVPTCLGLNLRQLWTWQSSLRRWEAWHLEVHSASFKTIKRWCMLNYSVLANDHTRPPRPLSP